MFMQFMIWYWTVFPWRTRIKIYPGTSRFIAINLSLTTFVVPEHNQQITHCITFLSSFTELIETQIIKMMICPLKIMDTSPNPRSSRISPYHSMQIHLSKMSFEILIDIPFLWSNSLHHLYLFRRHYAIVSPLGVSRSHVSHTRIADEDWIWNNHHSNPYL